MLYCLSLRNTRRTTSLFVFTDVFQQCLLLYRPLTIAFWLTTCFKQDVSMYFSLEPIQRCSCSMYLTMDTSAICNMEDNPNKSPRFRTFLCTERHLSRSTNFPEIPANVTYRWSSAVAEIKPRVKTDSMHLDYLKTNYRDRYACDEWVFSSSPEWKIEHIRNYSGRRVADD